MTQPGFGRIAAGPMGMSLTGSILAGEKAPIKSTGPKQNTKGECHGINSCKGNGECSCPEWDCAGNHSCKGHGWVSKTANVCKKLGGTFKADAE